MLDSKKTNILLAMAGAAALMASSPVLAQAPAEPTPAAAPAPAGAAPAGAPTGTPTGAAKPAVSLGMPSIGQPQMPVATAPACAAN